MFQTGNSKIMRSSWIMGSLQLHTPGWKSLERIWAGFPIYKISQSRNDLTRHTHLRRVPTRTHPRLKIAWADLDRLSHLQIFTVKEWFEPSSPFTKSTNKNTPPAENSLSIFEPAFPSTEIPSHGTYPDEICLTGFEPSSPFTKSTNKSTPPAETGLSGFEPAFPSTIFSQLKIAKHAHLRKVPTTAHPRLKMAWADLNRLSYLQIFPVKNHLTSQFTKSTNNCTPPAENRLSTLEPAFPYTNFPTIKLWRWCKKSIRKLWAHRESWDPLNCTPPAENRLSGFSPAFPSTKFPS